MKKLFQISLWFLFVSIACAQEASAPKEKILRVYDWKDLNVQATNCQIQIVSMDGVSVLKIENTGMETTNNISSFGEVFIIDKLLKVPLLRITNSVVKRTYWVTCELKYENVQDGNFQETSHPGYGWNYGTGALKFWAYHTPSAPGGDEREHFNEFEFRNTSNWKPYQFAVDQSESEGSPTRLIVQLYLPGHGTVYIRPIKLLGVIDSWGPAKRGGMVGGAVGIFGGMIGCLGGLLGCLAGFGKARKFVLTTTKIFIALGMLLTITGIVAITCGQPFFVWYVFLLPGVMLTLIFSLNFPLIQRRYDDLEIRRMASIDAMGS